MSDKTKENELIEGTEGKWSVDNVWIITFILLFCFGGTENPRINELEKKVARLEGQMSMIGGKNI